jgi:hypothetical protein
MTHHRHLTRRLAAVTAVAAAFGASTAQASPHRVAWTQTQLNQLGSAYGQKNPGWVRPGATAATTPAEMTWTREALDALAAAYAARNPGWTRP